MPMTYIPQTQILWSNAQSAVDDLISTVVPIAKINQKTFVKMKIKQFLLSPTMAFSPSGDMVTGPCAARSAPPH